MYVLCDLVVSYTIGFGTVATHGCCFYGDMNVCGCTCVCAHVSVGSALGKITEDFRYGVGSFVDKNTDPYHLSHR